MEDTIIFDFLEGVLEVVAEYAILIFEYTGVIILTMAAIYGIIDLFRHGDRVRLCLGQRMGTGLQFLMGAEIVKTVITHDLLDLAALGALVVLRTVLALVVHWETTHEEHKANGGNGEEKSGEPSSR